MARQFKVVPRISLSVTVDASRVRMQAGEPVVFLDVQKDEDRAANPNQIVGSLRIANCDRSFQLPCHQHTVVYCS